MSSARYSWLDFNEALIFTTDFRETEKYKMS
jgi:hypothetical protein